MVESPNTIISTDTHWSPLYVLEVELIQCSLLTLLFISTYVPGVQRLAVVRSPWSKPPSNWHSRDTGNSWSFPTLAADCECIMTPLLRTSQEGPPFICFPTKRYSTTSL